jgi:polyhydroxybutyrate depolymerase
MTRRILVAVIAIAVLACVGTPGSASVSSGEQRLPPGTHLRTLEHEGRNRSYLVHIPPQAASGDPLPVVLAFHGGGGNAKGQEAYSEMDALADEAGFIVVYPNGTGRFNGFLLTWNAGGCCGYARENRVDDVGFSREVIRDLAQTTAVDASRIYATGLSNGAMMAYRLAAEAPDLVSAIAPVAGAVQAESFAPGRPIPVLHFHSVDDPRALYDGGLGPPFPLTASRVNHVPVDSVLEAWARNNGCGPGAEEVEARVGPSDAEPAQTATHLVYPECAPGGAVELWRLTGAGHVWPGGVPGYLQSILGPSTDVIDANREMWEFFRRFRLETQ